MLKEIKELKKISKSQQKMSKKLKELHERFVMSEKQETYTEYKYYEELSEEENSFFIETVFKLIEKQIDNELEDVKDINFYHNDTTYKFNMFLDLDKIDDPNNITKSEWNIFISMEKDSDVINLEIKDEELSLKGVDIKKINDSIDKLRIEYNKIKRQGVIRNFDYIIQKTKLSRSEFLNNLDFLDNE